MPYHRRHNTPPYCTSYDPDRLIRTSKLEWVDEADPYAAPLTDKEIALGILCGIGFTIMFFGAIVYLV